MDAAQMIHDHRRRRRALEDLVCRRLNVAAITHLPFNCAAGRRAKACEAVK